MSDFVERVKAYLFILQNQKFEIYPLTKDIEGNIFEYVDRNGTHLKIRNLLTMKEYFVPLEMIDFANPGQPQAILRLKREMIVRGNSFV